MIIFCVLGTLQTFLKSYKLMDGKLFEKYLFCSRKGTGFKIILAQSSFVQLANGMRRQVLWTSHGPLRVCDM